MLRDLVLRNRSYRRFDENQPVTEALLHELVDLARLTASAANKQPLRYWLSCTAERNARVFPSLRWAGYLHDWNGPEPGERPTAYIVLLGDTKAASTVQWDDSIAAQTMLLGATEHGLGGCIIAAIDRDELRTALKLPARYEIALVVALGVPRETVVIDEIDAGASIKYWRDDAQVHHVPKRRLEDVIIDFDEPRSPDP